MMRYSRITLTLAIGATAVALLSGCVTAEAASPETKNTPLSTVSETMAERTPTATPTPPPVVTEEPEPEPTSDVPPPWSWKQIDGTWCGASGTCQTIVDSTFTVLDELWVLQEDGVVDGCFIGDSFNRQYPGMGFMYCPAGVATPFTVFNSEATSAEETVMNDDPSRERIWFYQGAGAETWFRQ